MSTPGLVLPDPFLIVVYGLLTGRPQVTKPEHIIASDVYQPSLDRLSASGVQTSNTNKEVLPRLDCLCPFALFSA